jgi:hypothetical protein
MVLMSVVFNGSWPVPISELVFASSPLSHELVATRVSNLGPETRDNEASIEANNLAVVKPQYDSSAARWLVVA